MTNKVTALNVGSFSSVGTFTSRVDLNDHSFDRPYSIYQITGSGNFTLDMYGTMDVSNHNIGENYVLTHQVSSFGLYQFSETYPGQLLFHCTSIQASHSIQILIC